MIYNKTYFDKFLELSFRFWCWKWCYFHYIRLYWLYFMIKNVKAQIIYFFDKKFTFSMRQCDIVLFKEIKQNLKIFQNFLKGLRTDDSVVLVHIKIVSTCFIKYWVNHCLKFKAVHFQTKGILLQENWPHGVIKAIICCKSWGRSICQ